MISSSSALPRRTRKRKADCSDFIRSIGFAEDHRFNVRWLKEACRILKPDGTIWVTGTHHIIFSLGFALQSMRLKIINFIQHPKHIEAGPMLQVLPRKPPHKDTHDEHARAFEEVKRRTRVLGGLSQRDERGDVGDGDSLEEQ
jgi:hypothetical protein